MIITRNFSSGQDREKRIEAALKKFLFHPVPDPVEPANPTGEAKEVETALIKEYLQEEKIED